MTLAGMAISLNAWQPEKALFSIFKSLLFASNVTSFSDLQFINAPAPIVSTEDEMMIFSSCSIPTKDSSSMILTPSGIRPAFAAPRSRRLSESEIKQLFSARKAELPDATDSLVIAVQEENGW